MMPVRRLIISLAIAILWALNPSVRGQVGPLPNSALPTVTSQVFDNFWMDGTPPDLTWPANLAAPNKHNNLVLWGSWCGGGERTGTLLLGPFKAPAHFSMVVAGMPFDKGNVLKLVRISDAAQIIITHDTPGNAWKEVDIDLPPEWVGARIQIVAYDVSVASDAWIGISEPFTIGQHGGVNPLWKNRKISIGRHWLHEIIAPLGLIFVLMNLMGFAGYSMLRRFIRTEPYMAPLLVSAVMAFVGYAAFWAFFISPKFGQGWVWGITGLSCLYIVFSVVKKNRLLPCEDWAELKSSVFLFVIAGIFYLGMMWIPRVDRIQMDSIATLRPVTWNLPCDNVLQQGTSQALHQGSDPRIVLPPPPPWTTGDRPPLQAGVQLLSASPLCDILKFPWSTNAQLSGLLLQLSWVYGVWALLRGLGCSRSASVQIVLCLIPTALFYNNSIFVWAKLSAAAFAVGMTTILICRGKRPISISEAVIAGALLSLGMLCHSGIFFYVPPILGFWMVLRSPAGRPGWVSVFLLIAVAGALFFPWMCYQKFYDPPGNHLLKLSFSGIVDADTIPTGQSIRNAYHALSGKDILAYKAANFAEMFKGDWTTVFSLFPADRFDRRFDNFFYLFRTCGVYLLGFLALPTLLFQRNDTTRRPVLLLLTSLIISIILWCLMMFGPSTTVIHAGAYGVPVVLLALLAYMLRKLHPIALLIVGVYNLAQFLWIYSWTFPYPPRIDPIAVTMIVIAGVLAMFLLLMRHTTKPV